MWLQQAVNTVRLTLCGHGSGFPGSIPEVELQHEEDTGETLVRELPAFLAPLSGAPGGLLFNFSSRRKVLHPEGPVPLPGAAGPHATDRCKAVVPSVGNAAPTN